MRHDPSTVVVLGGLSRERADNDRLLSTVGRSMNVALVRPEAAADRGTGIRGRSG